MSKATSRLDTIPIKITVIRPQKSIRHKHTRSIRHRARVATLIHPSSLIQETHSVESDKQQVKTQSLLSGYVESNQADRIRTIHLSLLTKPNNATDLNKNNENGSISPLNGNKLLLPTPHIRINSSLVKSQIKTKRLNQQHLQAPKYKLTSFDKQEKNTIKYNSGSVLNGQKVVPNSSLKSWHESDMFMKHDLQTKLKKQTNKRKKQNDPDNDQPKKMANRKKRKKYFCCPCTPLCLICSLICFLLVAGGLTSLLVALLVSKPSSAGKTITTTTTTSTSTTTASCIPACMNNGTCIATNTCQCIVDAWIGSICQTPVRILWTFDNSLEDFYGYFPATGINGPGYGSPGINGYGSCIYLNASASQSITVSNPPFLNMAYTSFSLSAWVKATSYNNQAVNGQSDNAIFGQHDQYGTDTSLHIIIRNQRIYFGFFGDDTSGNMLLVPNTWYHTAYVYDYSTLTQYVYVDGMLDGMNSIRGPYKGSTGDMTIGTNAVFFPNNYWDGCIDQISYYSRAKNDSEVLSDATLTVAYTFENTLTDSGPMGINGTGTGFSYTTSGRLSQALSLLTTVSYVQAHDLVLLGTSLRSYSMSIWIYPTVTTIGTIIHVASTTVSVPWSIPVLGFTNTGNLGVQGCSTSGSISITGPVVLANVWTHVAITYGASNGLLLWINGTQFSSSTSPYNYTAAGVPVTLTLGKSLNSAGSCSSGVITTGQYLGYLDEFQLYSRELSSTDVWTLANP